MLVLTSLPSKEAGSHQEYCLFLAINLKENYFFYIIEKLSVPIPYGSDIEN